MRPGPKHDAHLAAVKEAPAQSLWWDELFRGAQGNPFLQPRRDAGGLLSAAWPT